MKLGILINNLGPTQMAYRFISQTNALMHERFDIDIIAFYENITRHCMLPLFGCMQLNEAWGYNGPLIATDLTTARKLIKFPGTKNKYFYVWDLEWLRLRRKNFTELYNIYGSKKLKLLARSASHAQLIANCWNREVPTIVDDFNINKIIETVLC